MNPVQSRNALGFSAIGHLYSHIFEPIFYIVALSLPAVLGMDYAQVLALIVAAKLAYGFLAPLAGWLADRWSTTGMMLVFFLGLGASAIGVGLSWDQQSLWVFLTLTGVFGSIYHPVGISWLLRAATNKGKAIGINGVFGGIGPAVASFAGGALIALAGWRMAFIVPGILVLLTGIGFAYAMLRGQVIETKQDHAPEPIPAISDMWRAGIVLSMTMLLAGLIYQSSQPALPKLFEERLSDFGIDGATFAVAGVYLLAGLSQIYAGHLADRYPAKRLYILFAALQAPLLLIIAWATGLPLVLVALLAVSTNMAAIPVENILLNRYTPARFRATAFGLKLVLSFGVSGLGVPMVAWLRGVTNGFETVFLILAASALSVALSALLLPDDPPPDGVKS